MSTIAAQCPSCGRKGNVPDKALGRQVKCPGCASTFTVTASNGSASDAPKEPAPAATSGSASGDKKAPWFAGKEGGTANGASTPAPTPSADGMITAQCSCGFKGRVPERYQGKQVKCRQCSQMFTVGVAVPADGPKPAGANASGPPAKLGDTSEDIALVPMETESAAATAAVVETECEVVEEGEVVRDPSCPVCGNTVKLPPNHQGKKARCPKCCSMFNVDGTEDDDTGDEEAPAPKKAGGSQAGTKKVAAAAAEAEAPADDPSSLFSNLDAPDPPRKKAPKRKKVEEEEEEAVERPAFKKKAPDDEEAAKRQSALILVAVSGGALVLLAGGLALVASFMGSEKEKVLAKASTPADPGINRTPTSRAKTPPTFARPATLAKKLPPIDPPEKKDPPPDPPEKKDPPAKEGDWADVSLGAARFGNARIKINAVWIDDVKVLLQGKEVGAARDVLVINYEIENIAERGAMNFFGWGGYKAKPEESTATLTDSKGGLYRRLVLEEVEGQVEARILDPGKRTADRILFPAPDEKVDYYRLELPAKNFGGEGTVRLQIPRTMVTAKVVRKDPDPMPKEENKKVAALRLQLRAKLAPDRIRACAALSELRADATPAVPDLIKLYAAEKDTQVRVAIVDVFKWIGPPARDARPTLLKALKDEFWMVRREAAEALSTVGADAEQAKVAMPILKKMLESKDEGVADAARHAIRQLEKAGK